MAGILSVFSFLIGSKTGRVIGAALLICALAGVIYHQIRQSAFDEAEQASHEQTVKVEQERKQDDAYLQDLDNDRLCREYFGDRSVPVTTCKSLRGLH